MKLKSKKVKLEAGMYEDAKRNGMGFHQFLEDHYAKECGEASIYQGKSLIEQMRLRHEMRKAGKEIPPTAFEIQLAHHGIKAFGSQTDKVEKFFSTGESAVLFPAFLANRLVAGLLMSSLVNEFVAFSETIDAINYQKVTLEDTEADRQLRQVNEGDEFPGVRIKLGKEMVMLKKYGRYLEASYEAIKGQNLNVLGTFIARIGQQLGIDETDDLIYVAVNGDGNSNAAGTTIETATSGTIALADVINWAVGTDGTNTVPAPYGITKFVGRKKWLAKYYTTLAGMNNPSDQFGFIGINLPRSYEWERSAVTLDTFIGVDNRNALANLNMGEPLVESEKLIRKQINGTALSVYSGFMVLDNNAVAIFDIEHA